MKSGRGRGGFPSHVTPIAYGIVIIPSGRPFKSICKTRSFKKAFSIFGRMISDNFFSAWRSNTAVSIAPQ
ncbi:hypothetical protein EX909_22850 [Salmonella enterica subsp. enterica serovar Litchfield]|nr:hypothetical protein [Salmonella enterica subsp. enterica serovar Typhimurium]ECF0162541.1 hypothetical protein [Salmonella enterica subsp. enterica serovar Litchfield]